MAKNKISEWSATSADNTDISNINIAEGCSPANVNNAIRTVMSQVKDLQAGTSGDTIPVTAGGTGSATATDARTALSAAKSGANSDITSLSGLTTALSIAQGGTGAITAGAAKTALSAASSGANSDITSLTGLTTALSVAQGGTGSTTLTSGSVVVGNGTSAVSLVAPSTSGNVLVSNGTAWTSSALSLISSTAQTASSSASISFTGIPSTVKRITVMLSDVVLSTGGDILVQVGAGSTQTTGYKSQAGSYGNNSSGVSTITNAFNLSGASTLQAVMTITLLGSNTWLASSVTHQNATYTGSGCGKVLVSGILDRVVISPTSGTMTSGTINIIYE